METEVDAEKSNTSKQQHIVTCWRQTAQVAESMFDHVL